MFRRRAKRTDVEQVDLHRWRYLPTGAEIFNVARDEIGYTVDGRTWTVFVERGPVYGFYPDAAPKWDDATPMTGDQLSAARRAIAAAMDWEGQRVDFGDGIEEVPAP